VDIDSKNINDNTPFLVYFFNAKFERAYDLVSRGANINKKNDFGNFALKHASIQGYNEIKNLVEKGADINQVDEKGRNLLHHAINRTAPVFNANFEKMKELIDLGIDLNK